LPLKLSSYTYEYSPTYYNEVINSNWSLLLTAADPEVFLGGAHGERVEHKPIAGFRDKAPGGGQGENKLKLKLSAESFLALERPTEPQNLSRFFKEFWGAFATTRRGGLPASGG